MRNIRISTSGKLLAGLAALAISAVLGMTAASAQGSRAMANVQPQQAAVNPPAGSPKAAQKSAKRYFIDFRSRSAQSYGHTFSVYGRLNAQGKAVESHVAGLSPITENPIPWMIGHVVAVPSETGATDGDTEDQYITASYRVLLNEAEYRKVVAYIKQLQAKSPVWHALLYNCNAFVADIAGFMGLKTPHSTVLLYPAEFITSLKELNDGRKHLDPSFAGAHSANASVANSNGAPPAAIMETAPSQQSIY